MPEVVIERLNALTADRDTIVTTEVGQHQMWAAQFLDTRRPRSFISSGGLGTMGFGFPAAIGAQAAYPDSLVVCLAGDGSFQMNSQEMATAKAAGLPVKVIIFDNQCLGMVRQWQQLFYHGRYSQTLFDDSPDYVKLAEAYGWHAVRVSDPAQLERRPEFLAIARAGLAGRAHRERERVPHGGAGRRPRRCRWRLSTWRHHGHDR